MHREPQAIPRLAEAGRPLAGAAWCAWVVLASLAGVLLLYLHTTQSLYRIWLRSDTFAHGLIVFPVFAYMVWNERHRLAAVRLAPCPPALALVALAGFTWLLGRLSASLVVEQFSVVAMVPAAAWALLGPHAMRVLAFPFAFLFLAVPFGEFLVPRLIDLTADFTVAAVKLSGIPIFQQGNNFEIPSGRWSVVEACSGIRYLMASVLGGMLFSYFFFRSWKRRAAMVLLSIVVALVGNWLRAYLIVMLGHLSGNELAAGVDHVVYGWLFFGVVIALMFGLGLRWAEPAASPRTAAAVATPDRWQRRWAGSILLVAGAAAIWPLAHAFYPPSVSTVSALAPVRAAGPWRNVEGSTVDWKPSYRTPALGHQSFARDDARVGIFIAYYRNQQEQDELIESRSTVTGPDQREWAIQTVQPVDVAAGGERWRASAAVMHSASGEWQVWQWYWIGGHVTANPYAAKAYLALNRLLGKGDDSAAVIVYTPAGGSPRELQSRLHGFVGDMWPAIDTALRATRDAADRE
jgi:exosortase A